MTVRLKRGFLEDAITEAATELDLKEDDAFLYWFYSVLYDLDLDDVPPDELIDGAGERQIDIFHIDVDESVQSIRVDLIQVKNTQGFGANIVSLMKAALDFIFLAKKQEYSAIQNQKLVEKISNVRELIRQYGNNSLRVNCYYVTLADEADIPDEAKQNRTNVINAYGNSQVFGEFGFHFVGVQELDRLVNLRRNKVRSISYTLPIIYDANRPSIIEFDSGGVRSVLCTATGTALAQLAQCEPRDAVFDANVRGNLGLGGQVNRNIYDSSVDPNKAEDFWFMNNGITMVCDKYSLIRDPDSPGVKIENLQIINGCQTTSTVRSAYEDQRLQPNVKVQVKIYESKDINFVNNVVIATNNQNSR